MPAVPSQSTLVEIMNAFKQYVADHPGLNLAELFYANGFPDWFATHANQQYYWDWTSIVMAIRNRRFFHVDSFFPTNISVTGKYLPEAEELALSVRLIEALAVMAVILNPNSNVVRSLQLDGFEVDRDKLRLVPLEGPVSAQVEEDVLTSLVKKSGVPNHATVLKHISDAHSLFTEGKFHPSLNESRNLLQALIDEVSSETDKNGNHKIGLPGGTKNRIEYLKNVGFFTSDEQAAFGSAWGSLSAGSHPGVPEREQARIGLVIALEFGQLMLLKFSNWKSNGYKAYS